MSLPPRQLSYVEGTLAEGLACIAAFDPSRVLVVSPCAPDGQWSQTTPRRLAEHLGGSWDAVVVDADVSAFVDVLGQAHGLVRAGGVLVVVAPTDGPGPEARAWLAVSPYTAGDVSQHLWTRVSERLRRGSIDRGPVSTQPGLTLCGTDGQRRVVDRLATAMVARAPRRLVLTADRGRGKSAALGLACKKALQQTPELRVVLAAATDAGAEEVLRFANGGIDRRAPLWLARHTMDVDVILVDEAAKLPVPVLEAMVERNPQAVFAFATTVHGYEGTGRGFTLRFVPWLTRGAAPVERLGLIAPIRWAPDDPVEAVIHDALLLDATPSRAPDQGTAQMPVRYEAVDRDELARDNRLLTAVFGLLVQAHYRTTPRDLEVLLDAPNVTLHVARVGDAVVGVNQVAAEGGWSAEQSSQVAAGRQSIRGHALAENLVRHLGRPDAGPLRMVRSVRIAVHPEMRRLGVAAGLVAHTHAHHDVDLFGTVFGATPELLRFRASLGYRLVRMSPARGERSGEPSVVMVRPFSQVASSLIDQLVAEAARDVPAQVELLVDDHALVADPRLAASLCEWVPVAEPLTREAITERVHTWAYGPRTFESCVVPVRAWARHHRHAIEALPNSDRILVVGRVIDGRPWGDVAADAGLDTPAAAMRRLRRVVRSLVDQGGSLIR